MLPLQRRSRSGHSPHATRVRAGCPGRHPDRHATGHAHARRPTRLATQRRRGAARRASPRTQPDPPAPRGDSTATRLVCIHSSLYARSPVHRARRLPPVLPACRDHRADRAPRGKYQVHGDTTKSKTIKTCVSGLSVAYCVVCAVSPHTAHGARRRRREGAVRLLSVVRDVRPANRTGPPRPRTRTTSDGRSVSSNQRVAPHDTTASLETSTWTSDLRT